MGLAECRNEENDEKGEESNVFEEHGEIRLCALREVEDESLKIKEIKIARIYTSSNHKRRLNSGGV